MRRALSSLPSKQFCRQWATQRLDASASSPRMVIRSVAVSTNINDAFSIPLTLVDIHLRDEQLPFAYFFEETLTAAELESSLVRVLQHFPVLGGRVNLTSGTIECSPNDTVSLSFSKCKLTLQDWLAKAPSQRLTPGRAAKVISPLFDCLLLNEQQTKALASIRVTHFKGGGTALGVNLSHVLADAASCVRFVQCWGREIQGLNYPISSNQRSHATCSGMLSPELLDILDLDGSHKQQADDWSLAKILTAMGVHWSDESKNYEEPKVQKENTSKDSHEYVSLTFSSHLLKVMKAHGMAHCSSGMETEFVSTNDVLTAFGWLMKRRLSNRPESNMSIVVNLRGRSDVDDFSDIEDLDGREGVFGNGIASIVATLPAGTEEGVNLDEFSAAAVQIRLALTEGLTDIPERLLLSRYGRPASTPALTFDCFAITSWQQFPLYDISFSSGGRLAAFRGHPSHPLPEGATYNSIIVPEKCGSQTYQLLAPSSKVHEAKAFHNEMQTRFFEWYDDHTN